ncbi:hypothetical protein [uncultured Sphingorhabdus sp.]|uniref:hypothetical protein n=1 Tax=uncultured Sphingorhabdus sp. TaxID=1686106 RepID=UPI002634F88B|nr:hypothetical protein [uncultured Sphingorhabdus sp.]HMS20694.1 hypothetical protein [Sphingorhabdus sp.]
MKLRSLAFAALAIAAPFVAQPAQASSDSTCYPDWKIRQTDNNGCSGTALLSPGNDTRVNLLMLLHDRHGLVGVSNVPDYDSYYNDRRRSEAEPFSFPYFAGILGPGRKERDDSSDFPWGTRCMSNQSGSASFIAAVGAAKGLSGAERATLAAARSAMSPQCSSDETARAVAEVAVHNVTSKTGKAFADYLIGAAAFYDGDFAGARAAFSSIGKTGDNWLDAATTYMIGRVALNQATESAFGEYGDLNKEGGDKALLAAAENGLRAYLKGWPNGEYAASARGLLRRVYWLGQERQKLLNEYIAQFAEKDASKRNLSLADLVQELDIKLFGELGPDDTSDPELLAVIALREMRYYDEDDRQNAQNGPISRASIEALRGLFAGKEDLFTYLLAAHAYYVEKNPAAVLKLIPANTAGTSYLGYSRQLLRAVAMDETGDAGARGALIAALNTSKQPFQKGTAELGLAMHLERSKALDLVYAPGSPIRDAEIREILLRYSAGPALLRTRAVDKAAPASERNVALYALLYKQLTRGDYAGFVKDSVLVPASAKRIAADDYETPRFSEVAVFNWAGSKDFACPALRTTASTLAANAKDPRGLLCLGEFVRMHGMDPDFYGVTEYLDEPRRKDELGGNPTPFGGKRFSRLDAYKAIIANPAAGADNRAYALHRAIRCYAPSGINGCDDSEQSQAQRKAWFQQLKREFPTSPWAKKLTVYW